MWRARGHRSLDEALDSQASASVGRVPVLDEVEDGAALIFEGTSLCAGFLECALHALPVGVHVSSGFIGLVEECDDELLL